MKSIFIISFVLTALTFTTTAFPQSEIIPTIANEKYPDRGVLTEYQSAIETHKRGESPKIIGGIDALIYGQPWQVSLVIPWIKDSREAHFCGGSLIGSEWLVTAAHCVENLRPEDFEVVAGTVTLNSKNPRTSVLKIISNPDFNPETFDNDIALVRITPIKKFDRNLSPIKLISKSREDNLLPKELVRVTGWGADKVDGEAVSRLKKIDISLISRERCNDFRSYKGDVSPLMLCAGTIPRVNNNTLIQDACQGDSGGPLVASFASSEPLLAGIVSWGKGCAEPHKFGVYTRIPPQTEWINRTISTK
ncbi:serine protease [Pseudomonas sp.]|uniref:serine protease n=1 Tax=Pseudomonas sp. TaxID=306 RepID=UPI002489450D|nr:serine protease [Pseudomonas sp.]MDI1330901.1 serine protease [Pseudomonas sp.]